MDVGQLLITFRYQETSIGIECDDFYVRYELPESLTEEIGDIGYGVRPSERNKGYATTMLRYALSVCKEKGKDKAVLGCYKDNLASARTIQKNGGVLMEENDNYNEGKISQYYLINL